MTSGVSITEVLRAFATVFPAELPDKTMIATVVLVARFRRPLWVWIGAVGAFAIHATVAVAAGSAIGLLPEKVVGTAVAAMFAVGAAVLFRSARSGGNEDGEEGGEEVEAGEVVAGATPRVALLGSFGLVALAEWGDLTQLATAGLAAKSDEPVAIWFGAFAALASVAALAATFGGQIVARVPIHRINYAASAVFACLAIWSVVDLV